MAMLLMHLSAVSAIFGTRHPSAQSVVTATFSMMSSSSSLTTKSSSIIHQTFDLLRSSSSNVLILDGGTGEELFRRGVPDDRKIWSAKALVEHQYHGILKDVHQSFLQAGSRAISTNSYGVVPGVGFSKEDIRRYVRIAGDIARESVSSHNEFSPSSLVFGSLGPLVESYRADLIQSHAEGVENYKIILKALEPSVDAFLCETMSCVDETLQVVDAISELQQEAEDNDDESSTTKPLLVSYSLDSKGCFRDGKPVVPGLKRIIKAAQDKKVKLLAILFNCSEPEAITLALQEIKLDEEIQQNLKASQLVLGAYANRLTAVDPNWTLEGSEEAQPFRQDLSEQHYFDDFVKDWIQNYNLRIVGGCCGITPEHISYIGKHLSEIGATPIK